MATQKHRRPDGPASSDSAPKPLAFAMLPHGLMADRRLHPIDKVVAAAILHHAWEGHECTASDTTLGDYAGVSRFTVQKSLVNLEGCGYVRRGDGPGKTRRSINVAWRDDASVVPPPPPTSHRERVEAGGLKLHERGERRPRKGGRAVAPALQQTPPEVDPTCSTLATAPVAPVQHLPVAPAPHKEEGIQEVEDTLSVCPSVSREEERAAPPEGKKPPTPGVGDDPRIDAAVKAFAVLTDSVTPRMRAEMAVLLDEVGIEIIEHVSIEVEIAFVHGRVKRNAYNYAKSMARRMFKEGGIPPEPRMPYYTGPAG